MGFLDKILGIDDELAKKEAATDLARGLVQSLVQDGTGMAVVRRQIKQASNEGDEESYRYLVEALDDFARIFKGDENGEKIAELTEYAESLL